MYVDCGWTRGCWLQGSTLSIDRPLPGGGLGNRGTFGVFPFCRHLMESFCFLGTWWRNPILQLHH